MINLNLEPDEMILLASDLVAWVNREEYESDGLVLTNKKLYCSYIKSNGLFRKSTKGIEEFLLSDIKILNGLPMVKLFNYDGIYCLQIQFNQGMELFEVGDKPKRDIPEWVSAIKSVFGIYEKNEEQDNRKVSKAKNNIAKSIFSSIGSKVKTVKERAQNDVDEVYEDTQEPTIKSKNEEPIIETFFCINCGEKLTDEAIFCPFCGQKVIR